MAKRAILDLFIIFFGMFILCSNAVFAEASVWRPGIRAKCAFLSCIFRGLPDWNLPASWTTIAPWRSVQPVMDCISTVCFILNSMAAHTKVIIIGFYLNNLSRLDFCFRMV